MSTSTVSTLFSGLVSDVGSILTSNLGLVFGILGALIGLAFVVRYFTKHVGGKK